MFWIFCAFPVRLPPPGFRQINQALAPGESIEVDITDNPYYSLLATDVPVFITRYVQHLDDQTFDVESYGTNLELGPWVRADDAQYSMNITANSSTNLSITHGYLTNITCDLITFTNQNPYTRTVPTDLERTKCLISAIPGPQVLNGSIPNCTVCPTVDIYAGGNRRIGHFTTTGYFGPIGDGQEPPLLIVVSPAPDRVGVSISVGGHPTFNYRSSDVIFSYPRITPVPAPQRDIFLGEIFAIVWLAILGIGILVVIGLILRREYVRRRDETELRLLSTHSQQFGFSQTIRYVDSNIID
jgi:hypothetical protein